MQVLAEAIDHDDVPKILHKKHHPGTIFYLTINGLRTKIEECKKNNYNYAHFEKVLLKWPSKPASQVTTTTKPTRFRKLA